MQDRESGPSFRRRLTKRLQRTGISVPLIDNLPHDAVVARPLKRNVGPPVICTKMEPRKFIPAEVTPQPCLPDETEKHLRAFAESFVDKKHTDRWIHLLIEKPEKAEKALHKFEHQLNEKCCRDIGRGADTFPSSLAKVYGAKRGVYFDGSEPPLLVPVAAAASLATERFADAIFSLEAGKRALFFHHSCGTWICEK